MTGVGYDDFADITVPHPDEPVFRRSWRPVDLTAVLDGAWQPPKAFMAGYKFDKSKSRWRIELDMNAPPLVRIRMLKDIWRRIATDEHQVEWNAADGAYLAPIEKYWDEAADDLLADITRALPAEREKYRLEIADELASQDDREASDR